MFQVKCREGNLSFFGQLLVEFHCQPHLVTSFVFQILKIFIEEPCKTYMLNAMCLFKNLNPEKFVAFSPYVNLLLWYDKVLRS